MVTHVSPRTEKKIPPVPGEVPLLGSIPAMLHDRLKFMRELARFNDVGMLHLVMMPTIFFNKPEHVHSILVEHGYDFEKGRLMHKAISGNGIFISEGEFHRKQRKLLAPSFQPRHIVSYAETMTYYGEQLQKRWHNGDIVDINREMTAVTMSIIGKVLFDVDVFDETDALSNALATLFEYTTRTFVSPFRPPLNWPTPGNRRMWHAQHVIEQRIQQMIDERLQSQRERNDFLSILLNARDENGQPMSHQQVMDECITLFAAGHETTAATLGWTWYLLCQHPDIYQRVRQEVDSVLQGRTPVYKDLERLPYSLQVLKETMRLYPAAIALLREAACDMEIDGYTVPKGMNVLVSPYAMHYNPEYYPDPERFDPDRFTPEREKQLPRYSYMPFGAGPRICIGNHFSMMEAHLLLATLVQRVTFEVLPGQTIYSNLNKTLTLRPFGPVNVKVTRRD